MPTFSLERTAHGHRPAARGTDTAVESARIPAAAFSNVVGSSQQILHAISLGCRVASHATTTVLLQGETGTGKELFARGIHYSSDNAGEPFVAINCSAIPENLLESELFGHERGSFTGADSQKKGLLELAGTGSVFLDEVGDLPSALQPKLLRVLEEKCVRRVGGHREIPISCRVIAATNANLLDAVANGDFREDLYYRLNVFRIDIPPLRERPGDIELLTRYFVDTLCRDKGWSPKKLTVDAAAAMNAYGWPGNVRELKNVLEGAIILADGPHVGPEHLMIRHRSAARAPVHAQESGAATINVPPQGLSLEAAERQLIEITMRLAQDNQSLAARMLGVSRQTILRKLKQYNLGE
jgi:two-component system response regulator AtoC